MSLYADYIRQEENKHVIENDCCFISYQIFKDEVYISDFYAAPESPPTKRFEVWDEFLTKVKDGGFMCITCVIWVNPEKVDYTTKKFRVFLANGFRVFKAEKNQVILKRELKGD